MKNIIKTSHTGKIQIKKQIRKIRRVRALVSFLLFAIAAPLAFPRQSAASNSMELLEVTGILISIDVTVTPNVITLNVEGEEASGPLSEECVFYDPKQRVIPLKAFVHTYTGKAVTVEILEETGQVLSLYPAEGVPKSSAPSSSGGAKAPKQKTH
ncbi:MAG: hypothetical protein LBP21_07885 [Synergistaceae bacterium]|jgi:hypothetical protein|nr:hypothetical protein [Synergistaceae bacterium]